MEVDHIPTYMAKLLLLLKDESHRRNTMLKRDGSDSQGWGVENNPLRRLNDIIIHLKRELSGKEIKNLLHYLFPFSKGMDSQLSSGSAQP